MQLAMHFVDAMPVTNKKVKTLEDLAPVIELYHHMVRAGNLDEAMKLFYDRFGEHFIINLAHINYRLNFYGFISRR